MITLEQLNEEIKILEDKKPDYIIMQELASLYIVRDHMTDGNLIDNNNEFYNYIKDKKINEVLLVFDDLMETLAVLNPRLYGSVLEKLSKI